MKLNSPAIGSVVRRARRGVGGSQSLKCRLESAGWNVRTRRRLERLIERGAGQRLPVVFDFDNTVISGDVGEAVLANLAAEELLTPLALSPSLCPPLSGHDGVSLGVRRCSGVMDYYEALLAPTVHGESDPTPLANGYVWATQALEGLSIADVTAATATVFQLEQCQEPRKVQVVTGGRTYPPPQFQVEMVELIARLLKFRYEVWIVSASNVWSVRWMVAHGLNPLLREHGLRGGVRPEHVIGVATLLVDRRGRFYKDSVLVRQNKQYAGLQGSLLKSLRLTRHVQYPAPVYSGKVACILDGIGRNPYLCAGDSPSDHPMMSVSRYRLWIARPEKPQAQQITKALVRRTGTSRWITQSSASFGTLRPALNRKRQSLR